MVDLKTIYINDLYRLAYRIFRENSRFSTVSKCILFINRQKEFVELVSFAWCSWLPSRRLNSAIERLNVQRS